MGWKADGHQERVNIGGLFITENLERVPAESAGPGEIIAIAGIEEITIGETLADAEDPHALPVITIDEHSLSMTVGVNTSPLAGKHGKKMKARMVKARFDAEHIGPVSIRVLPTERPDTREVPAQGERTRAVRVEMNRRAGLGA